MFTTTRLFSSLDSKRCCWKNCFWNFSWLGTGSGSFQWDIFPCCPILHLSCYNYTTLYIYDSTTTSNIVYDSTTTSNIVYDRFIGDTYPKMVKIWIGEDFGLVALSWNRWAPPETGATDKDYKPIARLPLGGRFYGGSQKSRQRIQSKQKNEWTF